MIELANADAESLSGWVKLITTGGAVTVLAGFGYLVTRGTFRHEREFKAEREERQRSEADWQKRLADERAQCVEEQKVWRERYEELKRESIERLGHLRTEKDYWRTIALKAANVAEVATDKATSGSGG